MTTPSGTSDEPQVETSASPPPVELRDHRPGEEAAIVGVLNACQHGAWGDEAFWRWKHEDRPGFAPDDVVAATDGESVVGCFHLAVLPLKLEDGLVVPMSFDGDFAVLPEFRGRDIAISAHDVTDERLRARGVVLRGGFTARELNERLYRRRFGYVFAPAETTQYRKYLGPGPLAPRVAALGERLLARAAVRRVLARPLTIDLSIRGFAPASLTLSEDSFRLERGAASGADLRLSMPYRLLALFADGGNRPPLGLILGALFRGELRVGGLLRSGPRLLRLGLALLGGAT